MRKVMRKANTKETKRTNNEFITTFSRRQKSKKR